MPPSSNSFDPRFIEIGKKYQQIRRELTQEYLFKLEEFLKEQVQATLQPTAILCTNYYNDHDVYEPKLTIAKINKPVEDEEDFQFLIEEEDYLETNDKLGSKDTYQLLAPFLPPDTREMLIGAYVKDNQFFFLKSQLIANI